MVSKLRICHYDVSVFQVPFTKVRMNFRADKTYTLPPFVHTGPAELDKFFNCTVCKSGA